MKGIPFKDLLLLLSNVLLSVTGQLLLKQGMLKVGRIESFSGVIPRLVQALANPFVIGGIATFGFTTLLWLIVLSRVKLSIAYPMISLGYILSIFFAWFFFKESVPKIRIIGAVVICIGVYLVASASE